MHRRPRLVALVLPLALAACPASDYVQLYATESIAPSLDESDVAAMKHLGPTLIDQGANFGVYSERAGRVDLLLFDDPEAPRPTKEFQMKRYGDVWNVYVEGIGLGQPYGYRAWGPNWTFDPAWEPGRIEGFVADVDDQGNRFNPNKLLLDPWAKAVHREHDWSKGSVASGPKRTESTYAAASKSVIARSEYVWSEHEASWREKRQDENAPGHRWNDLILYEVHVKGFTRNDASGVEHRGTFRGFGEKAAYFAELGITGVELMPIHEKPTDGGYWGYQTLNFFAPELSYSSRQRPGEPIDEFKWMVDQLHQQGIEVIIDVVYNHTGEGGLWREKIELNGGSPDPSTDQTLVNFDPEEVAGIFSFRGLDNAAWYALDPGGRTYWNNTGVGNQTRPNHRPMRKLTMDSLRWYAEEMHVDGFRFDLAPILGERDGDYNNWDDPRNTVLQDVIDDPILQQYNTRIIAEPWSAGGSYGVKIGAFPAATDKPGTGWGEWNGRFRDWWRAFVNFDDWKLNSKEGDADGGFLLTGSFDYYDWNGRRPYHTVNFVTVHDGMTMYDLFSYAQKQNLCGPLNPICCDQPMSAFCDRDSGENNNRSRDWGQELEDFKRQQMRNLFVGMLISHGTPMLLGGDEWMRTQLGNNNAYTDRADNAFNWFDWGIWQAQDERWRMFDFVKQAIRFRKDHAYALAPATYGGAAPFSWKNEGNAEPPDWTSKKLMIHYYDPSYGPELAILINMESGWVPFTLPENRTWTRLIDTQLHFDTGDRIEANPRASANATLDAPVPVTSPVYDVPDHAIVILEALP